MSLDQVTQHGGLRSPREPHALREFPALEPLVAFLDVTRRGARRVAQLRAGFEVTPEIRTGQKQLNAQIHLMRELPGGELSEVSECGHATEAAIDWPAGFSRKLA
jgi:hypothetical protein